MAGSNYSEKKFTTSVTETGIDEAMNAANKKAHSYGSSSEVAGDDSDEMESLPAVNTGKASTMQAGDKQ